MSNEFLMAKGRLADCRNQIQNAELRAESYMISLRELLDPYRDFCSLELEKVLMLAKDFRDLQLRTRELLSLQEKIKDDFGL